MTRKDFLAGVVFFALLATAGPLLWGQSRQGIPASLEAATYFNVAGDAGLLLDGTAAELSWGFQSETGTGIYLPKAGRIGFAFDGVGLVTTFDATKGIDTIGSGTFGTDLTVGGDTTLGDGAGDTLAVDVGSVTFTSNLNGFTFDLDAIFTAASGLIRLSAPSVEVEGSLEVTGDTALGDGAGDTTTVLGTFVPPPYIVHKHLVASALSKGKGSSPPGEDVINTWFVFDFSSTSDEEVFATWEVPENYLNGSDFLLEFRWAPTNTNTGTVVWGVEYEFRRPENSEALGAGSTTQTVLDAGLGLTNGFQESGVITLDGTGVISSDVLSMRLYRDVAPNDDYNADAALVEVHFHFTADRL